MTAIPHSETGSLSQAHSGPVYSAYRILQVAFVVAPIIAGIDKFTDRLVNWDMYLAPVVSRIIGGHDHVFMMVAGVIEIVAGILVALKPRFFAFVVAAWLLGIIVNLLLCATFFDIALRDLGLCLGACALGLLAQLYDRGPVGGLMTRRM